MIDNTGLSSIAKQLMNKI